MERLRGAELLDAVLLDAVENESLLTPAFCRSTMRQVLTAIRQLHDVYRIYHRDVRDRGHGPSGEKRE